MSFITDSVIHGVVGFANGAVAGLATSSTAQVLFGMAQLCPNPFIKVLGYTGAVVGTSAVGVISMLGAEVVSDTTINLIHDKKNMKDHQKKVDEILAAEL